MKNKTQIQKVVELKTENQESVLKLKNFELFGSGSLSCEVEIWSRGFGLDKVIFFDNVDSFLVDLEKISCDLQGEATLKEDHHDHYIKFSINNLGHVSVDGYFIEYSEFEQTLSISFKTDQTCLLPFTKDLLKIVENS